jgi:hypothetical protein
MRIPDDVLKCVCFLCIETIVDGVQTFRYGGTGFFVGVPSEKDARRNFVYFVTARHNIQKASLIGPLYLRINTLAGESQHLRLNVDWTYPEKDGVDLALLQWAPDQSLYDYRIIQSTMFTDSEVFQTEGIGPGDELFCVGLFTYRHGAKQNYPIVRSGIIASMPNEPFKDHKTGFSYDAYLAEVRSIGGLSGSPVFVGLPAGGAPLAPLRRILLGTTRTDKPGQTERFCYFLSMGRLARVIVRGCRFAAKA